MPIKVIEDQNDIFKPLGDQTKHHAMIAERDAMLAVRFYFYANLCRLNYQDCITSLTREFFIRPMTIEERLKLVYDRYKALTTERPTPKQLAREYPWLSWRIV